jgi:endoglucanase
MNTGRKSRIRLLTALSALCLVGGAVAMAATPASAATSHHVNHLARYSLSHLPAPGASAASFEVINYNSGLCLGVSGGKNDQDAVQWTCNGHADQQWHWGSQNASYPGWYQLVNNVGSCLGVTGGSASEGARVVGWTCDGSTHYDQYWAPQAENCGGYVPLENLNSGYVLGVSGNSTAVGADIVQYAYQGVCNNQFWYGV